VPDGDIGDLVDDDIVGDELDDGDVADPTAQTVSRSRRRLENSIDSWRSRATVAEAELATMRAEAASLEARVGSVSQLRASLLQTAIRSQATSLVAPEALEDTVRLLNTSDIVVTDDGTIDLAKVKDEDRRVREGSTAYRTANRRQRAAIATRWTLAGAERPCWTRGDQRLAQARCPRPRLLRRRLPVGEGQPGRHRTTWCSPTWPGPTGSLSGRAGCAGAPQVGHVYGSSSSATPKRCPR
jgi:hypothetical protein